MPASFPGAIPDPTSWAKHADAAAEIVAIANALGVNMGNVGTSSRQTTVKTTGSLTPRAYETGTVQLAKGYRLYRIDTSAPARVRLYTTAAKRDADLTRTSGIDPQRDHGLVVDYLSKTSVLGADLSPQAEGYDGKSTPDGLVPYTITNYSSTTGTVTVTFTWVKTE